VLTSRIVTGGRVYLRLPKVEDEGELLRLNTESRTFHRGLAYPAQTKTEFAALLDRCHLPDSVCFLICLNDTNAIAGMINLSQIFMGVFRSAYLGYYIGARYAKQGYMTEAVQLMLRYGFRNLKLHRVEANIQPGNFASIALVRHAGFRREGYSRKYLKIDGRWRDHERWAILAEDWLTQKRLKPG
jgi:[ribosomal protein S5]-alanine N-acetyltransferase